MSERIQEIAETLASFRELGVRIRPTPRGTLRVRGAGLLTPDQVGWLTTHKRAVLDYFRARATTKEVRTTAHVVPREFRRAILTRTPAGTEHTHTYASCGCEVDPERPDWCPCRERREGKGRHHPVFRLNGEYRRQGMRRLARDRGELAGG